MYNNTKNLRKSQRTATFWEDGDLIKTLIDITLSLENRLQLGNDNNDVQMDIYLSCGWIRRLGDY